MKLEIKTLTLEQVVKETQKYLKLYISKEKKKLKQLYKRKQEIFEHWNGKCWTGMTEDLYREKDELLRKIPKLESTLKFWESGHFNDIFKNLNTSVNKLSKDILVRFLTYSKYANVYDYCSVCGKQLDLKEKFIYIPFSFCVEYDCGITICKNCVKKMEEKLK